MDLTFDNAISVLKKYLKKDKKKYKHSIRVAKMGLVLAKKWKGADKNEVLIAALLHDIGKSKTRKEMFTFALDHTNIPICDFEFLDNLAALHGFISAELFETEFKESIGTHSFERIKNAISRHVAGAEKMTDLDMIIFIADNIEPEKKEYELFERIEADTVNMNDCVKYIIEQKK